MPRSVEVSPSEAAQFRNIFPGSAHQKVVHNFLALRIRMLRQQLETVDAAELIRVQAAIAQCRAVLAVVHSHDGPETKRIYDPEDRQPD